MRHSRKLERDLSVELIALKDKEGNRGKDLRYLLRLVRIIQGRNPEG